MTSKCNNNSHISLHRMQDELVTDSKHNCRCLITGPAKQRERVRVIARRAAVKPDSDAYQKKQSSNVGETSKEAGLHKANIMHSKSCRPYRTIACIEDVCCKCAYALLCHDADAMPCMHAMWMQVLYFVKAR